MAYAGASAAGQPWEGWPACPCGCGVEALKLTKHGHVTGCSCRSCIGRRSRAKGRKAQTKAHRNLGGVGVSPTHEEQTHYAVVLQCEVKTGAQVPASFDRLIESTWFRRAIDQAVRAVPAGSGALPCVVIRGDYAVVDLRTGRGSK